MMTTEEWNDKPAGSGGTAMTANPFAALLAGVPRLDLEQPESHMGSAYMRADPDGYYVRYADVLAALAAAVPADLAEAGKVADWLRDKGPWDIEADGQPHEIIRSLIALATAQEAQIKGLEASAGKLRVEYRQAIKQRDDQIRIKLEWAERAFSAETALAAERAKVAKLVEALNQYQLAAAGYVSVQSAKDKADAVLSAITEAGQ